MASDSGHSESVSLVPVADTMVNCVAISILLLLLTVISGASVNHALRLPREKGGLKSPITVFCSRDRIIASDPAIIARRAFNETAPDSFYESKEVGDYIVTRHFIFGTGVLPKEDSGEGVEAIRSESSGFSRLINNNDPAKSFIYFLVYPSCISTYREAVAVAERRGFEVGWEALPEGGEVVIDGFQHETGFFPRVQ